MSSQPIVEMLSASASGFISSSALYPLELIKTRMQSLSKETNASKTTTSSESTSEEGEKDIEEEGDLKDVKEKIIATTALSMAKDIYEKDGVAGFYKGKYFEREVQLQLQLTKFSFLVSFSRR